MLSKLWAYQTVDIKTARRILAISRANSRSFWEKVKKDEAASESTSQDPEEQNTSDKEQNINEKQAEEADKQENDQKTQEDYDEYEQEFEHKEETANFSTSRKIFFVFGKAVKYSIWAYIALFSYHFYLVRRKEKPEQSPFTIDLFLQHATRFNWHIEDLTLLLTRPPVEKLMPDRPEMPPGMSYPKTLVLGLRGITVHSEYLLGIGFEYKKRPGLSTFLQHMSKRFEVVIFGDEESNLVQEICEALDPEQRMIVGRIGHESTLLKDGKYIKDLSYMNRDVKDIICIDFDEEKFSFHKRNVIKVPKWEGEDDDRVFLDIIPFLDHLARPGVDVRKELDRYGHENPQEKFIEVQKARRDIIMKQREKGIGGLVDKIGTSNFSNATNMNTTMGFSSRFNNE